MTTGFDTTGASVLIVALAYWSFGAHPTTFDDSYGNTWTNRLTVSDFGTGLQAVLEVWECQTPTVGVGHTFAVHNLPNFVGVGSFPLIEISAWSGTGPSDTFNATTSSNIAQSNPQAGSITPSRDNSLILSFLVTSRGNPTPTASAYTVDSGFTILDSLPATLDSHGFPQYGLESSYLIQGPKAAVNPMWTPSPASTNNAPVANLAHTFSGPVSGPYIVGKSRVQLGFVLA